MGANEQLKELFGKVESSIEEKFSALREQSGVDREALATQMNKELGELREKQAEMEKRMTESGRNASLPGVEGERAAFSFARAAMLTHPVIGPEVARKKEFGLEMEIRAQTATDGTAGGYTVPTELAVDIVEPALEAMPLYQAGMTVIRDIRAGTFEIPVLSARGDAGHTTENGTPTNIEYTFGQKTMTPKRAAGYAKVSKRLMRLSSAGIEQFIRRTLSLDIQRKIHNGGLINGTGSDNQPTGLANTSGFTSTTALSNAQATLKTLSQMKTDLEEANFDTEGGRFAFLMRPIVAEGVRMARTLNYSGQTSAKGFQLSPPVMSNMELGNLIGAPILTTSDVATSGSGAATTSSIYYGDFTHLIMAMWSGLEISASDQASDDTNHAFLQNMVFIKAEQEYDCVVDLPTAFCRISDALANRSGWTDAY